MSIAFSVTYSGLSLKITLDEKWQARPLLTSVVGPYVKAFNKKRPDEPVHEEGLAAMLADGDKWIDVTKPATATLSADTSVVELYFTPREAMASRSCRVACGETELKIDLERKWLRQPLSEAVLVPFVKAYNKKHGNVLTPAPLSADALSSVTVDGNSVPCEDIWRPTALVLPFGCKRIDLGFAGGIGGAATGGRDAMSGASGPAQLRQLWGRVRSSPEQLANEREVRWTNMRLCAADGASIAAALNAASQVRCDGSYGEGLGKLLTLNLQDNDLTDGGLVALVRGGGLHMRRVMVSLRDLYLQNNRIGDAGVEALLEPATALPGELKILQLQDNWIGDAGLVAIERAFKASAFKPRHLNLLDNKYQPAGAAAELLRETTRGIYTEIKMPPST